MIVIVNNEQDLLLVQKKINKATIYTENYNLFLNFKNKNVLYFYDYLKTIKPNNFYQDINNFWLNWYRDNNFVDKTVYDNISIGQLITRRIIVLFNQDIKNLICITNILTNQETVYFFKNSSESLERLKINYPELLSHINIESINQNNSNYNNPDRAPFFFPKTYRVFYLLRFLQNFFKYFLKNKILYEVYWSSEKYFTENSKNILFRSKKNIFKSYYHLLKKNNIDKFDKILPKKFSKEFLTFENLKNKFNFKAYNINEKIINHFIDLVTNEYSINRKKIVYYFAFYIDIFKFYKPKSIIIAGQNAFFNIIAIQIAKKMNVNVQLCLDGYNTIYQKFDWYLDYYNKNILFDSCYAFGLGNSKLYQNNLKLKNYQIKVIDPPVKYHIKKINQSMKYDAMILAYSPNLNNPNTFWDSQLETECEIIYALVKNNFNNIAIKFKNGAHKYVSQNTRTIKLYNKLWFHKYNEILIKENINIEFIFQKELYQVINETKIIVGQISSALIESVLAEKYFFIYEPYRNGISDKEIETASVLNLNNLSRNMESLETNIKNNMCYNYNKKFVL